MQQEPTARQSTFDQLIAERGVTASGISRILQTWGWHDLADFGASMLIAKNEARQ
jgi:hypothetical protein